MKRNAWIAAIAAAVFSTAALAQMGPGYGGGPGRMMGGYGGGYGGHGACGMNAGALDALGLTAQQRQQVASIMDESATERLALMDQMHDLRVQGVRNGTPDYAAMAAARDKMATLMRTQRDRIDAVLTPEQRSRLNSGWHGFGMGGGRW
jgi:Spy/CpxP family protein refolding chaperone